jgi:hypothetical protein
MNVRIFIGNAHHVEHARAICDMINEAAARRGTGIARRSPEYVAQKLSAGEAIIALNGTNPAGFCYLETWSHGKYVANSGLIVAESFRQTGLAGKIKRRAFELSQKLYPEAKLFGITTSLPVMKINSDLGYKPVTFSELTDDEAFWKGCESCQNHDILLRNEHKMCLCTGMMFTPKQKKVNTPKVRSLRWENFKRFLKLRKIRSQRLLKTISIL